MSLFTLGARLSADARRLAATIKIPREDAIREIRRLAAFALRLTPAQLVVRERESPGRFDLSPYGIVFDRRLKGEPMAYILGEWGFFDHVFKVTADVLIPRPETEGLVEAALERLPSTGTPRVLDVGTGSGCIALSVGLGRPNSIVVATDVSGEALEVARGNCERLSVTNVTFVQSDWFGQLSGETFDLILSNPPYIIQGDTHLDALKFEPAGALVAGADGLDALRAVIGGARDHLVEGGALVVEHGYDQRDAVLALFEAAGFATASGFEDLAGRPRFVAGVLGAKVPGRTRRKRTAVGV